MYFNTRLNGEERQGRGWSGRGQAGKGTVKNKTREAQRMGSISRTRDAADKSKKRTTTGGVSPRAPARSADSEKPARGEHFLLRRNRKHLREEQDTGIRKRRNKVFSDFAP